MKMAGRALPMVCVDCGGVLNSVTLFGRGNPNPLSGAADDSDLHFATGEASRRGMFGMFQADGVVRTLRCEDCSRIFLYGVLNEDLAGYSETTDCLQCGGRIGPDQESCPHCGWTYR